MGGFQGRPAFVIHAICTQRRHHQGALIVLPAKRRALGHADKYARRQMIRVGANQIVGEIEVAASNDPDMGY